MCAERALRPAQVKAWCYYESRLLGAHHGLLSSYALETMVLYIFNIYHRSVKTPFQARPLSCQRRPMQTSLASCASLLQHGLGPLAGRTPGV